MTRTTAEPSFSQSPAVGGSEHVLVVDDDDLIRELVLQQLVSLGYRVSDASDGPAALEIIRESADIDLLFTDIVMSGGMSGLDLAAAAVTLRPNLRVLCTSGNNAQSIVQNGRPVQDFEFLRKPYRRQELAQRLRKVLDG